MRKKRVTIFSVILLVLLSQISYADSTYEDLEREHVIYMNRKINTIRIMAVGDIMMHMPIVNNAYKNGGYEFDEIFKNVTPLFKSADIVIANLETTLTSDKNLYSGYPRFKSPLDLVHDLKKSGFNVLITANNHSLDGGRIGLTETIEELNKIEIAHTGSYISSNNDVLILEHRNLKIGIVAYTYGTNGLVPEEDYFVNYIDKDKIESDYNILIENNTDIQIISMHWGTEYNSMPNDIQIELETFIKNIGFDVLLGSHPHVLQKVKFDGNYFAIYSMGNFLSNQRDRYKDLGVIVDLTIEKHEDEIFIRKINLIPTWVDKYKNGKADYSIVNLNNYDDLIDSSEVNHVESLLKHFNDLYK